MFHSKLNIIILLCLILKLGGWPFFKWILEVCNQFRFTANCLILTLQKLAPFFIIVAIVERFNFFIFHIIYISSALIGAIKGIYEYNIFKLLAFSSVSNLGWILSISIDNAFLRIFYFLVYSVILILLFFTIYNLNISHLLIIKRKYFNIIRFLILGVLLWNIRGTPPFIGFLIKLLRIRELVNLNLILNLIIFCLSRIITLYFYLRLITYLILSSPFSTIKNFNSVKLKFNNLLVLIIRHIRIIYLIVSC